LFCAYRQSDDIDIAVDNVSGVAFAEDVNRYMVDQGLETHTIGVVKVRAVHIPWRAAGAVDET
jgi:hypothetical protein